MTPAEQHASMGPAPGPPGVALRPVASGDLPTLFEQQLDPEANRRAVVHPRDAAAFAAHWRRVLSNPAVVVRAIIADGELAGQISCFKLEGLDSVGYWLGREFWGRGVASRALELFLRQVETRPLHARAARSNSASIRVLQKCGFTLTGYTLSPASDRFPECEEAVLVLA